MNDQADLLRRLVDRHAEPEATAGPRPRLVAVAGGKGGVGTTTITLNLAIALAQSGYRTVLVDADLTGGDVQHLCQLPASYCIADVLAGRRTIHEVLQRGPAGVQIVPGVWALGEAADASPTNIARLLNQIHALAAHADVVVIDAGSSLTRAARTLWQAADQVLLVTTPDTVSVMDAYAAIKVLMAGQPLDAVKLLVNQTHDAAIARDVGERIGRACRRFLGHNVASAGHLPPLSRGASALFVRDQPAGDAAALLERIASQTIEECQAMHHAA